MFCANCGNEIQDKWSFCLNCGEPVVKTSIKNQNMISKCLSDESEIQLKPSLKLKRNFINKKFFAVILTAVVVISLLCLILHESDEDKIISLTNELAAALNEGDSEKMISCFEPSAQAEIKSIMYIGSEFSKVDLWSLWSMGQIEMSNSAGNSKLYITVYNISITSDTTAVADISIDYGTMGQDRSSVICVKIDEKWYFSKDSIF